ncbi:hypothetical protein D7S89_18475 [Trinickia fusca]|uniref:Uncharacterized protein n=2 Tax=Trinickia fusca TaxID=2419777 RepID=A0A494X732_9BURK|nr:hypothetical protein D7S89_18475 [Trinickia fusca]
MNIDGKYVSEDRNFILTITNSNGSGTFDGTYVSKYTPRGEQTFKVTGRWYYVVNETAPLSLGFTAFVRPDGWPYVIEDAWTGVLSQVGKLYMTGVRSYLPNGGTAVLSSLGTFDFYAQ